MNFGGPWSDINWPQQGVVSLFGGKGVGKSSLAALLAPKFWLTKEQEPKPVADMFYRINPDNMPEIINVDNEEEVDDALEFIEEGPIVIDSLSAFGLKEGLSIAHKILNWSKIKNQRALAIMQANASGGAAGYKEINHIFDAVVNPAHDPWGVRILKFKKNRWGPTTHTYYTFNKDRKIVIPTFDASYSVEGSNGEFYLHPYPVKGAKWTGILDALADTMALEQRMCSSAISAAYMENGFLEPMDAMERRRFAEKYNLRWVSPEDLPSLLPISIEE